MTRDSVTVEWQATGPTAQHKATSFSCSMDHIRTASSCKWLATSSTLCTWFCLIHPGTPFSFLFFSFWITFSCGCSIVDTASILWCGLSFCRFFSFHNEWSKSRNSQANCSTCTNSRLQKAPPKSYRLHNLKLYCFISQSCTFPCFLSNLYYSIKKIIQ